MDKTRSNTYFDIKDDISFLKQHLSLSTFAFNIIDNDIDSFTLDNKNKSLSGFLNRIFKNYYKDSKASIEFLKDKKIISTFFKFIIYKTSSCTIKIFNFLFHIY